MNGLKRGMSVLLAALCLLPLAACGDKKGKGEALSEFVYVPNYASLPKEVTEIGNPIVGGGRIYFTVQTAMNADGTVAEIDVATGQPKVYTSVSPDGMSMNSTTANPMDPQITYVPGISSIKIDGTDFKKLSDYAAPKAPSEDGYASLDKLAVDAEGNIWAAETISKNVFDLPEGFDPATGDKWKYYVKDERQMALRKLSETGAELANIDISEIVKGSSNEAEGRQFYFSDMVCDKAGNLYISDGNNTVYVMDKSGAFSFKVTVDSWMDRLIALKDGSVSISSDSKEGGKRVLKVIDVATKAWGKDLSLPDNVYQTSSGGSEFDFCYTDGSNLNGYDVAAEKSTQILSWLNSDVDGQSVSFSTILEDGNVLAITNNWGDEGSTYEIITLVKTPRSEVKQKTSITLATMWLDQNLRKELLKFNKTDPDYRIEVLDYSQYNTDEDYTAGQTKLNTEIISGKVPDLIDVSNLPYKQYAAKGLLEDIYTFIDKDPDLSKEDFIPSIIKASETEGKLYQLPSNFGIMSIVGSPDVVGDEMGWTMDEMEAIIKAHPKADAPFGLYMTKKDILQGLCMLNMANYVNWQTGECKFDTDEFKKLLTFANSFPKEVKQPENGDQWVGSDTLVPEGRQLFEMFSANDFQSFQFHKATFGGKITFKGFPTETKKGNVAMLNGGLSMTTSCKDKDGAWKFMRMLMTPEYQEGIQWNYPITQKAFDKALAKAMVQEYTTDENGNKVPVSNGGMSMGGGASVEFYAMTQPEADQLKALINSVENTAAFDNSMMSIINEEAEIFFAGEKSVEETANIIQSRMKIYINEQR
ncbi:MAG: extracellular solute-binding protein [Oscillospiraceae bacterium]